MAHLALSLLGPPQVALDGLPVSGLSLSRARALLAYLAVERDRAHPRQVLADLLWPDSDTQSALTNLRHVLAQLRQALGDAGGGDPPFLLISREAVQLNPESDCLLDVAAFEQAASDEKGDLSQLAAAAALYHGPFLEGFSVDSAPFEEWATVQRERWQREVLAALGRLAGLYEGQGDYPQAQGCARRALALEPTDERWHRQLMRALALGGERSAALAQYEACRRVLAEELDVEPGPETAALYEAIREGALRSAPRVGPIQAFGYEGKLALPQPEEVPESPRPLFVAREEELARLDGWLNEALRGQGRVGFVIGEPGSGKTMLLREFGWRAMEAHPELIAARGACNATSGVGDPYLPFLEILQTLLGDIEARRAVGGITHEHARRLQAATPDALGAVLKAGPALVDVLLSGTMLLERACSLPDATAWIPRVQEAIDHHPQISSQTYLFEQATRVLQALAVGRPLLLILDDLQWSDVASIGLLFHLGRRLAGHRILVLGAYRPEEVAAGRDGQPHPLQPVVLEFQRTWGAVQVDLAQAEGQAFVEALVDAEPNRLGPAFRRALYEHTAGHALFATELLRGMQERGDLARDPDGRWIEGATLDWERLPERVEAVIAARIARLPREEQELLAAASVEGEEFHAEVAARVRGIDEREAATRLSGALAKQHRLVAPVSLERRGEQRLSRYRFRHYLFQQYLYQGLDPLERARLHEEVGNSLEGLYGDRFYEDAATQFLEWFVVDWTEGATRTMPESSQIAPLLGQHFQRAGLTDKALMYLYMAMCTALLRFATEEVLEHVAKGLQWVAAMPDTLMRAKLEAALQLDLSFFVSHHRMWNAPEAGPALDRALELARRIGQPFWIAAVLGQLGWRQSVAGELTAAESSTDSALEHAQLGVQIWVPRLRVQRGFIRSVRGHFRQACEDWAHVVTPFVESEQPSPQQLAGVEPDGLAFATWYVWALGHADRATRMSQAAFRLVLSRPTERYVRMLVLLDGGVIFHHMRREMQASLDRADELLALTREEPPPAIVVPTMVYRGWALTQLGQVEEGIDSMRQGLAEFRAYGDQLRVPHFLALLAEGYLAAGRAEQGLTAITEALKIAESRDERYYEAEIHRIKGELLLLRGADPEEVEEAYRRSIEVAQGQGAKSFELRATTSLARLLRRQGRGDEARETLAAIYGWFTEGFDTPDRIEAKRLLEELAQGEPAPA